MSTCEFCLINQGQVEGEEIYHDAVCRAVMHLKPAAPGHILLFTKQHYPILEHVPDQEVEHIFTVANKLSTALFESLNIQGTNILVENGVAAGQQVAHFSISIIPRTENDGLPLEWAPQQLPGEEMQQALKELKAGIEGGQTASTQAPAAASTPDKPTKVKPKEGGVNYLIERLKRIP